MTNPDITPAESVALIRNMIAKAKNKIGQNSFYFLLWGWLAFAASLLQFVLLQFFEYPKHYLAWLLMLVGSVASALHTRKQNATRTVTTFGEANMQHLWTGIGISFFTLIILFTRTGWAYCYGFFIVMYGLGTYVSGQLLQFRPLIVGGICCWPLAVLTLFVPYPFRILLTAVALLVSYLIPGHLLQQAAKHEANT